MVSNFLRNSIPLSYLPVPHRQFHDGGLFFSQLRRRTHDNRRILRQNKAIMNTQAAFRAVLLVLLCGGLLSCATSTPQTRIQRNPALYQGLSPQEQQLVAEGKIAKGMSQGAVFLAWGRPDRVGRWNRTGREVERWFYLGYHPVYVQTFGFGMGWGPYDAWWVDPYWHTGQVVDWVPHMRRRVEFVDGKVTEWEYRSGE